MDIYYKTKYNKRKKPFGAVNKKIRSKTGKTVPAAAVLRIPGQFFSPGFFFRTGLSPNKMNQNRSIRQAGYRLCRSGHEGSEGGTA